MKFFNSNPDNQKYFFASYDISVISGRDLRQAAWELAIGQSVGNPNVRNQWETDALFEQSACIICHEEEELHNIQHGIVKIGFPIINTDWASDGVTHLLCQVMGGQVDIDLFRHEHIPAVHASGCVGEPVVMEQGVGPVHHWFTERPLAPKGRADHGVGEIGGVVVTVVGGDLGR